MAGEGIENLVALIERLGELQRENKEWCAKLLRFQKFYTFIRSGLWTLIGLVVCSRRLNISLHVASKYVKTSKRVKIAKVSKAGNIYYLGNQSESSVAKSGERKPLHDVFIK